MDLPRAFAQVPLHKDAQAKTAITTPFGLYEYTRMPFGLCNVAQTFQRLMDTVLRGMPRLFCYLDDVLVFSPDVETQRRDLKELSRRLTAAGLVIKPEKCVFGVPKVRFVGFQVSGHGIEPLPDSHGFDQHVCTRQLYGLQEISQHDEFLPQIHSRTDPTSEAAS